MSIIFKNLRNNSIENGILLFGKYRNMKYSDIAETDPEYLVWCAKNGIIKITDAEYNKLNSAAIAKIAERDSSAMRRKKNNRYDYRYGIMPDYDTDNLGDWFYDVPF